MALVSKLPLAPSMKYNQRSPYWRPAAALNKSELPPVLLGWLFAAGSMTQRLRQQVGQTLKVKVEFQGWQLPRRDERLALGLTKRTPVIVREVVLMGNGQPWLLARSLFPQAVLNKKGRQLQRLGEKPLGDWLFKDKQLVYAPFEFAALRAGSQYYQRATEWVADLPLKLWCRRRMLYLQQQPLLIQEIFLPAIWQSASCTEPHDIFNNS